MSDDAYGATVAKWRLSRRLAELRSTTGYTANHVCDILNWGRGKVDSKRPEGGAHVVDRTAFARFLADVQGGVTTSRHVGQVA